MCFMPTLSYCIEIEGPGQYISKTRYGYTHLYCLVARMEGNELILVESVHVCGFLEVSVW